MIDGSVMSGADGLIDEVKDLLLDVWREACRHIEIGESAGNLAKLIGKHLPIAALQIRRVHAERHAVETVGMGATGRGSHELEGMAVTSLDPVVWRTLLLWAKEGSLDRLLPNADHPLRSLFPNAKSEVVIGPLTNALGLIGIVALQPTEKVPFAASHMRLCKRLLEPLSIALDNDRRLRELNALRQAAEAEKRSLLNRLGRQDKNEEIVGSATGLRHVMERVVLVSQSDVPVLILGETGTGKEVVARAIHTRSQRADGPFIRVNCGAIPPELIDSQLFGHEKGSFTGAAEQHQGWFERADGGTLFLDEIGELPLAAQVRLLRVLQDHFIERVGGKQPLHVDVRIVAATHRDLASMVKAHSFREDLWYRINIFPILLPRLRERIEDIPALVKHLASKAAIRFCLPAVDATPEDIALLASYPWPGNIRELGAVIDRAVILGNGKKLEVSQALGLGVAESSSYPSQPTLAGTPNIEPGKSFDARPGEDPRTLDDVMADHIRLILMHTRGRVEGRGGAADRLGINPHTLRARMRKLQIDWTQFRT